MTDTSGEIDLPSKLDIIWHIAKVKLARLVHSMADVILFVIVFNIPFEFDKTIRKYISRWKNNIRNFFPVLMIQQFFGT